MSHTKTLDEYGESGKSDSNKYGPQFDGDRFADANAGKGAIGEYIERAFDAHNFIPTEPAEAYDNFAPEKEIHQILDYGGIDFVVDPFDAAPFGINHRTHTQTDETLRFDLRKDTGTSKPSELDELLADGGEYALLPRYGSRAKRSSDSGFEWVRIIDLRDLVGAINAGLTPSRTWTDGDVVAWMFDYDLLRDMNAVYAEFDP